MKQQKKDDSQSIKHGRFKELSAEAERRKAFSLEKGNGLGGNGHMPHVFCRDLLPIVLEYDRTNRDIVVLYAYLLAHTNGDSGNDRYMSAFPSLTTIDKETGISRNRIPYLSEILEAIGMLKTALDRTPSGHNQKLYFPQYYSDVPESQIRAKLEKLAEERKIKRAGTNRGKDYLKLAEGGG